MDTLLTKNDVARRLCIGKQTVHRLRQSGRLPWIDVSGGRGKRPIVRFRAEDVIKFESAQRIAADTDYILQTVEPDVS